jgi:thioesterase domain-containing protein
MYYFGCNDSTLNKDGEHWKPYYKKTQSVALKGIHTDMLKEPNATTVIDSIVETLEKQRAGTS